MLMMRGVASTMEKHHRVQMLDEALEAAVKLSHRYIPARQLPDKSVSLLDTACARVADQPARGARRGGRQPRSASRRWRPSSRSSAARRPSASIRPNARRRLEASSTRRQRGSSELDERWSEEKELVEKILEIRGKLRGGSGKVEGTASALEAAADAAAKPHRPAAEAAGGRRRATMSDAEREGCSTELRKLQSELHKLQGERPLILPTVDHQAVAAVVADWTGIPVGRMVKNEVETVLKLADTLEPARHRPATTRWR